MATNLASISKKKQEKKTISDGVKQPFKIDLFKIRN